MNRRWQVIQDPPGGPQQNMNRDEALSRQAAEESRPILRIYQWDRPAVSLGRRQDPAELPPELLSHGFPMVRRPTGGGAVVHQPGDFTYAIVIPSGRMPAGVRWSRIPGVLHERLREELVSHGLIASEDLHASTGCSSDPAALCFTHPVCGDLLYRGRKVAGSALRKRKEGLLLQGTFQGLPVPRARLVDALSCVIESFH